MSQETLALECGVHPNEISLLETEKREPRLATIVRLSRALRLSPAQLLEGIK